AARCRRTTVFQHVWRTESRTLMGVELLFVRCAGVKARRRHHVPGHERFRKRLARLQAGGSSRRAEQQPALGSKPIGDPETQRELRSDDGEIGLLAIGEPGHGADARGIDWSRGRKATNSGIAGGGDELADVAVPGQAGHERVLARAATENKNSHRMNRLWREWRLHAPAGRARLFR